MKDLPERFPAKKVPPEKLAELAARARAQAAQTQSESGTNTGLKKGSKRMNDTAANLHPMQSWLRRARLGVLDVAALVALALLCGYLLLTLTNRPGKQLAAAVPNGSEVTPAGPNDPKDKDKPPAPAPEKEAGLFDLRTDAGRLAAIERFGGTKNSETAVDQALRWLAYHQEADGHWDVVKYDAGQKVDTAVTSLALLAFLGAGNSEAAGEYKDNVKRGIMWLKSKQAADGLVFDRTDAGGHRGIGYPHAIAMTALAEAAAMGGNKDTIQAAQSAVDYAVAVHMDPSYGGWRYGPKQQPDLSVSSWYINGLYCAKAAGLSVDTKVWAAITQLLNTVEMPSAHTYRYMADNEHPGTAHRLSMIGANARMLLGGTPADVAVTLTAALAKGGTPAWGANGDRADLYYWYWGTLASFRAGGPFWRDWTGALQKALIENQCKTADDAGSWPIVGDFSAEWGRTGQTALGALCLEAYYRYTVPKTSPLTAQELAAAEQDFAAQRKQNDERLKKVREVELQDELTNTVSFNIVDEPLEDAVKFLSRLTSLKVKLSAGMTNNGGRVTLRVSNMEFKTAIEWIARMVEAEVHTAGEDVLLYTKAELDALKQKGTAPKAVTPPKAEGF